MHNWLDYGAGELEPTANTVMEAIDTVIAEVETKTYTAEDMEEFAQLVSEKYNIEPELSSPEKLLWYEGGFLQTGETYSISQLRELWEQEMRKKED